MSRDQDPDARQALRSPLAVAIWWLWVLFAVANLIDIAIQGRDRQSALAAVILVTITGVMYATAQRPRIVTDPDGLTIVNPFRVHRVRWATVAGIDADRVFRIRCEWRAEGETETRKRSIYPWAIHSSGRSQLAAQARTARQARRFSSAGAGRAGAGRGGTGRGGFGGGGASGVNGSGGIGGFGGIGFGGLGGFGRQQPGSAPPSAPLGLDAVKVAASLTERAEKARADAPEALAAPPASSWHWPSVAAVAVPALALLIVALA